eukprot:TRINITY_DN54206_c0_g1_i1.p1 TRINITY_DN54206_c0_g1~~TRINITY_DN54206_c0_g1_i1.p1  ORF type:complete len:335 (+),score=65.50 TRINITY_DN54206_c0_g1_i1:22-1005(+)
MDVSDKPPPQKKRLELTMSELRESVEAAGSPDEGMRGTLADKLKLKAASDQEVLLALASALQGQGADAVHAAAVARSISITPQAAVAVCKVLAFPLCGVLQRRKEPMLLAWSLAALIRWAQHVETHTLLKRAGAVSALATHSRQDASRAGDGLRLHHIAALGLAFLSETGGHDVATLVPLKVVPSLVRLLEQRLVASGPQEVVEARTFCGLPVDYRPRFVTQALALLCEASAAHAAVAWQSSLPEVLAGLLSGSLPNDTESNHPFGSPDVVEMADRCRAALLARQRGDAAPKEAVAALRAAPGAPKGTWERRGATGRAAAQTGRSRL